MKKPPPLTKTDCVGLIRPAVEAHTLGISSIAQLLEEAGYPVVIGDAMVCDAISRPADARNATLIEQWIRQNRITVLGFSYRLDPMDGAAAFQQVLSRLQSMHLLAEDGGPVKAIHFAGLPAACEEVRKRVPQVAGLFSGDETPAESLIAMGVPRSSLPASLTEASEYDEARLAFGRDLIRKGNYLTVQPIDRSGYDGFGTRYDTLIARIEHGRQRRLPPLMRAHVGPYGPNREEAVQLFLDWTKRLAKSGLLDILSVGTSQLTQSHFGQDWTGLRNGGGVPLNSPAEFAAVWEAARPMLVRCYAGTTNIPDLARMYEQTICIAWHALSFWWFCRIDGRGPYSVMDNLRQHLETLRFIASSGKPFEPNIPHHFAFRGGDDVTYIVSSVLAARTAKSLGVRHLVLQNMLNTPKATWGIADLAKSRAMLQLVRELEDNSFRVLLQPRAGLDYFSSDPDTAKTQLVAASVLMDDIEPHDAQSPPIIHVVSHSEASHLANPAVVEESVKITRHAIEEYRRLRARGDVDDMSAHTETNARTSELLAEARTVLKAIESAVPSPCSAEGLHRIFSLGFLTAPYLWECRDEFQDAVRRQTRIIRGSVKVVDADGIPVPADTRTKEILDGLPKRIEKP